MDFTNKVVLITGAGRGLGRAIAQAFAGQGAIVAANDLTPVNLDKTIELIRAQGGSIQDYLFDVAKRMPVQALVEQALADWGRIDVLINNAGVAPHIPLLEMDEWDWQRTLDVNLSGVFYLMQSAGRIMRQQGGGVMINLAASQSYLQSDENIAALHASKLGVIGLTKSAARELAAYGIRVNAVCPGWVEGELAAGAQPRAVFPAQTKSSEQSASPLPRFTHVQEVASLVMFLSSDAAKDITGQTIEIGA